MQDKPVNTHDTPAYWEALGRFAHAFAAVERTFTVAVLSLIDSDFRVSGAIIAGRSFSQLIQLTRQIFPVKRWARALPKDCERVLAQMEVINSVRNLVLHNGTLFSAEGGATTQKVLAGIKPRKKPEPVQLSVEVFQELVADCERITYFWYIHAWYTPPELIAESVKFRVELQKPWSYKE